MPEFYGQQQERNNSTKDAKLRLDLSLFKALVMQLKNINLML
jgi:hypothetical protein